MNLPPGAGGRVPGAHSGGREAVEGTRRAMLRRRPAGSSVGKVRALLQVTYK